MDADYRFFHRRTIRELIKSCRTEQVKNHFSERVFITRIFYFVAVVFPLNVESKSLKYYFQRFLEYSATAYLIICILGDLKSLLGIAWLIPAGLTFSTIFTAFFSITIRLTVLYKRQDIFLLMVYLQDILSGLQLEKHASQRYQLIFGTCICYVLPAVLFWFTISLCFPGSERVLSFYVQGIFFGWSSRNKWTNCAVFVICDHFIVNQQHILSGLLIVLCWYLLGLLRRIIASFEVVTERKCDLDSLFNFYVEYSSTISRCKALSEQALSLLLLFLYGFMVFSVFNVTTFLMATNLAKYPMSMVTNQMAVLSVTVTGFYFMTFQAVAVHDAAIKVKNVVHEMVSSSDSSDYELKYLILTLVSEFPSHVVVSGWGLFSLRRRFLAQITSGMFTYAVLLIQMGNQNVRK
ncbi:hypothetical protein AVEN_162854-1 [Araneus ventricosus]|uniref:Gustatory receptor n=1 Tax=Araneus ventricosus TaxID=182803 RepID=A0A4Y2C5X2_ARAVE|nr:hypothetical protein AVEN_162854-1 [Araneus ventricosus]